LALQADAAAMWEESLAAAARAREAREAWEVRVAREQVEKELSVMRQQQQEASAAQARLRRGREVALASGRPLELPQEDELRAVVLPVAAVHRSRHYTASRYCDMLTGAAQVAASWASSEALQKTQSACEAAELQEAAAKAKAEEDTEMQAEAVTRIEVAVADIAVVSEAAAVQATRAAGLSMHEEPPQAEATQLSAQAVEEAQNMKDTRIALDAALDAAILHEEELHEAAVRHHPPSRLATVPRVGSAQVQLPRIDKTMRPG
jgi:hypothetical protein